MLCLKIAGWVANSVDPDETPRSAASHLGLYCLLRSVCPNTYGKYGSDYFSQSYKKISLDAISGLMKKVAVEQRFKQSALELFNSGTMALEHHWTQIIMLQAHYIDK